MQSSIHFKRRNGDLIKLANSGIEFEESENEPNTYYVLIRGPKETPYEDGYYWLRLIITPEYPFKSPSVAFLTPIFHPNIEYDSGAICLDALNQQWTPVFNFERIFQIFIPQLLSYPNPNDPFHLFASELLINNVNKYNEVTKKVNDKYASVKTKPPYDKVSRSSSDF